MNYSRILKWHISVPAMSELSRYSYSKGNLFGKTQFKCYSTRSDAYETIKSLCLNVFENDKYVILNKANDVDVMDYKKWSTSTPRLGLFSILNKQIDPDFRNVHRIDKFVTGGLLIAKNKNVAKQFSKNLQKGGNKGYIFKRRYVAIIPDSKLEDFDDSVTFIKENKGLIRTVDEDGVESITKFILYPHIKFKEKTLAVIQLETGKRHQIRKHFSYSLDKPLHNDVLFNGKAVPDYPTTIGLHSSFIYTKIGLKEEKTLIPIKFSSGLWNGFINEDGFFSDEINSGLTDFDQIFSE